MGFGIKAEHLPEYTYKNYLLWEGNWEIIHGVPYAMSPGPSIKHQRLNTLITRLLNELMDDCGKCEAIMPVDWKISETTVVQPDVSIICQESGNENYIDFAPTVIFEILSPSTQKKDRTLKYDLYEDEGVKYYVIVSPEDEQVEVFQLNGKAYELKLKTGTEKFVFNLEDCSVEFDFSKIWA